MRKTFNEKMEWAARRGDEWPFGSIQTDLALVPPHLRALYTPYGVVQRNNIMDTQGCASRSPLNILETKLNWFYDNGMHPEIKKWCDDKGYRQNGKFALNDAFIEILSGTTPQGNSLKAPVDAIRKYGVIPAHLLPLEDGMTWEQYMDRNRIKQEHLDLGKEFLRRITINYEQVKVSDFLSSLEEDLLDVAGHAWAIPVDGIYRRNDGTFNHAFAALTNNITAFDTYDPFIKLLAKDYRFFEWGYSLSITAQNPYPDGTSKPFTDQCTTFLLKLLSLIEEAVRAMRGQKPTVPVPVVSVVPPAPKKTMLNEFCKCIEEYEGYIGPSAKYPKGTPAFRNRNPGNIRDITGAFLVFDTYEQGFAYLKEYVLRVAKGKHRAYPKDPTILQFFHVYAPTHDDNQPDLYAKYVAKKLNVPITAKIHDLVA